MIDLVNHALWWLSWLGPLGKVFFFFFLNHYILSAGMQDKLLDKWGLVIACRACFHSLQEGLSMSFWFPWFFSNSDSILLLLLAKNLYFICVRYTGKRWRVALNRKLTGVYQPPCQTSLLKSQCVNNILDLLGSLFNPLPVTMKRELQFPKSVDASF